MGIITNLKHFRLGIDNLDQFILIIKNWPIDTWLELKPKNMVEFLTFEVSLIGVHKKMFEETWYVQDDSSFDFMWPWLRF